MTRTKSHTRPRLEPQRPAPADESPAGWAWVTRVAFGLSVALVLARVTMLESLRDALEVTPDADPAPRPPGAATSLVLDLVAWLPALLVLARGALDPAFRIRFTWSHRLMFALAAWTALSPLWAADKFAAAVSAFHWLSATVFLWSASQLVRSWARLRVVAGACLGLLLVFGATALSARYVEQPELRKDWEQNREQHLQARGFDPASINAKLFEAKLLRGEIMGFFASPNTFAAVTVLLLVVTLGTIVQRLVNRDGVGWIGLPVLGVGLAVPIIVWVDSKTAFVTPLIAAGVLGFVALAGGWLRRHAGLAYAAGVAGVALVSAAVVGHGLFHGSLVIDSLTFRWRYWVGAARVFAEHPLLGVGWESFRPHYLAARLPIAAEEVRDPHNFLVRFFTELGVIGGVLAVAWMLRLWWEITRPAVPAPGDETEPLSAPPHPPHRRALPALAAVVIAAAALSVFATVDFGFIEVGGRAGSAYVLLRLVERGVGAAIVLAGMWAVAARSTEDPSPDDRPAPWLLYAVLAGLGVFLMHNLVDFAMFEVGPMFLFALLAGSALGTRQVALDTGVAIDATASRPVRRGTRVSSRVVRLAVAGVLWLVAAIALVVPVLRAEEHAAAGDEHLRTRDLGPAVQAFREAAAIVPHNADYPRRAARVLQLGGATDEAIAALDAAVRANPYDADALFARAAAEHARPRPDVRRLRADYERALGLDPANVPRRIEYAAALQALGSLPEAREQYAKALWYNDQLSPDEIERLQPAKLKEVQDALARLPA